MNGKLGIHAPNCRLSDFTRTPGGPSEPAAFWYRVGVSRVNWLKLLSPDHDPADGKLAKSLGLKVIVRAPGEGIVHWETVRDMLTAWTGCADVLEVGNEPYPGGNFPDWDSFLWNHAAYLEGVAARCPTASITLCAPAWQGGLAPPVAGARLPQPGQVGPDYVVTQPLANRLQSVYSRFPAQAIHAYDPFDLMVPAVKQHIDAWLAWRPGVPIYLTEVGIAARYLVPGDEAASDLEKARRYKAFIGHLPDRVLCACVFIAGGLPQYAAWRGNGGYDPINGDSRLWLSDAAYVELGRNQV